MKYLKFFLLIVFLFISAIVLKVTFFSPFDQKVSVTKKSPESNDKKKLKKIVLAGPFATVSHPLIHMVNSGALSDVAQEVEFRTWRNPDHLRAMALKGDVDFIAIPTNVAANLYNKKQKIQLINVSVWGILGMMTRDENLKKLKDFKGKKIIVPFRADMPDIVLRELISGQGLDPEKDFDLNYVASPIDAMQMLLTRRADHVLLAEPAISMALRKTKSFPISAIAPTIFRSANLQDEWASTFKTTGKMPQAGIAALGHLDAHVIDRFQVEYGKALDWYVRHPKVAGIEIAQTLPMLDANAIADSIPFVNLENVEAREAKDELEKFFKVLEKNEPKLIGGKLPDSGFYYP